MPIFTVIAFSALILAIVSMVFAIIGEYQFYWLSALGIYVFSFIAGFSIGQFTVGLTFVLLALAIGYTLGLIRNKLHLMVYLLSGTVIGALMVLFVDDYWLFFPLFKLMGGNG